MANQSKTYPDGLSTGNEALKYKVITGTTGSSQGNSTFVAHGLTSSKIVGFICVVSASVATNVPPSWTLASGYEYHINFSSTDFEVSLSAANSSNILSKTFKAVIYYLP